MIIISSVQPLVSDDSRISLFLLGSPLMPLMIQDFTWSFIYLSEIPFPFVYFVLLSFLHFTVQQMQLGMKRWYQHLDIIKEDIKYEMNRDKDIFLTKTKDVYLCEGRKG